MREGSIRGSEATSGSAEKYGHQVRGCDCAEAGKQGVSAMQIGRERDDADSFRKARSGAEWSAGAGGERSRTHRAIPKDGVPERAHRGQL